MSNQNKTPLRPLRQPRPVISDSATSQMNVDMLQGLRTSCHVQALTTEDLSTTEMDEDLLQEAMAQFHHDEPGDATVQLDAAALARGLHSARVSIRQDAMAAAERPRNDHNTTPLDAREVERLSQSLLAMQAVPAPQARPRHDATVREDMSSLVARMRELAQGNRDNLDPDTLAKIQHFIAEQRAPDTLPPLAAPRPPRDTLETPTLPPEAHDDQLLDLLAEAIQSASIDHSGDTGAQPLIAPAAPARPLTNDDWSFDGPPHTAPPQPLAPPKLAPPTTTASPAVQTPRANNNKRWLVFAGLALMALLVVAVGGLATWLHFFRG
jgi:hypothetical protein